MKRHAYIRILSIGLVAALAACSLTGPKSPITVVAPGVNVEADPAWPTVDWSIQIQRPVADQMRDADRLLVRIPGSRLQVYGGVVWLDQAPEMLQTLLIQSFEDAARFDGVGRAGRIRTRYILATELRHFEAVDDGGPDLKVELVVQGHLIHQRSSRSVATRAFRHEVSATGKSLDPLVMAFETALSDLIGDLIGWSLEEGQRHDLHLQEMVEDARDRGDGERRSRRRR